MSGIFSYLCASCGARFPVIIPFPKSHQALTTSMKNDSTHSGFTSPDGGFDFSRLNPEQREAVEAIDGKVKVVAGAGAGKTRVLASRYAYLVSEVGVDPANILCMTFTNKAAQEMKTRIAAMLGEGGCVNDFVCTIHGFCVKVLRREIYRLGYPKNFLILDEEDCKGLAKQVMEAMHVERTDTTVRKFLNKIAGQKATLGEGYVEVLRAGSESDLWSTLPQELQRFLALQQKFFALDFDDIVNFTLFIFNHFREAREYWQNEIDYVEVDEVQDCNLSDWAIINLITARSGNLFIVGDPDQAIYEWRGAMPDSFVDFSAGSTVILNRNYRSTPQVLAVANSIITRNRNRIPKNLVTDRPAGAIVKHYHGKSEPEETKWVAETIDRMVREQGAQYSDFAILYRASHLSRAFEQALVSLQVPYAVWGGVRFFERREIKDALAYLQLVVADSDMAFRRIVNVPSRKFGEKTMASLEALAQKEGRSLMATLADHVGEAPFNKPRFREFVYLIEKHRMMSESEDISGLLESLYVESGLKDSLRFDQDEDRLENVQELLGSVKLYEELHAEDEISPASYLQDIALYTNADYKRDDHKVKLMTIHQAKGLEFGHVFVVGLTEGLFPSHRSIRERGEKGEEEERRLMYVAVTRACDTLTLVESEGYNYTSGTSKYPSRFLQEIAPGLVEVEGEIDPALLQGTINLVRQLNEEIGRAEATPLFEKGTMVRHKLFGEGIVIENYPGRGSCRVEFGSRRVALRYDVLTPLS